MTAIRATFSYDCVGNRTLMADSTGRYTFAYNTVSKTTSAASPNGQRTTYTYDAIGLRRSMDVSVTVHGSASRGGAGLPFRLASTASQSHW